MSLEDPGYGVSQTKDFEPWRLKVAQLKVSVFTLRLRVAMRSSGRLLTASKFMSFKLKPKPSQNGSEHNSNTSRGPRGSDASIARAWRLTRSEEAAGEVSSVPSWV